MKYAQFTTISEALRVRSKDLDVYNTWRTREGRDQAESGKLQLPDWCNKRDDDVGSRETAKLIRELRAHYGDAKQGNGDKADMEFELYKCVF